MKGFVGSNLTVVGCALVVGAAVGVAVAYPLLSPNTPDALKTETELDSIRVTMQEFDDPRAVEIAAEVLPPVPVVVGRSGTLTSWECARGSVLTSGESSIGVDGVGLLNLSTAVPLWRDIRPADTGADVRALEVELRRMGQPVEVDSSFSYGELRALTEFAARVGVELDGVLSRQLVVWLPAPSVAIDTCERQLSASVVAGDSVATVDAGVLISPVALPEDRIPGPRSLELLPEPVPLGEEGELPAHVTSEAVRATDEFREAASGSPGDSSLTLEAVVVLREPVQVAALPATAIAIDASGKSCVFVAGEPRPVTVVGSEFGNSFVVFSGTKVPSSVDAMPGRRQSCM